MQSQTVGSVLSAVAHELGCSEGTDAHLCMHNIKERQDVTAVISIYDHIKPAHMVLNELYNWAKVNNPEVAHMIELSKRDMSWNPIETQNRQSINSFEDEMAVIHQKQKLRKGPKTKSIKVKVVKAHKYRHKEISSSPREENEHV